MKAYITLITNDTYAPGALVLAHRLRDIGSIHDLVCLVTHQVSNHVRALLLDRCYTRLVDVQELFTTRFENLLLLGRPELGATLTKIQLWGLTEYTKLVFLDADTLPIRNIDDLFSRPAFSAAPDTGWPDCFNSGVFVAEPSDSIYQGLLQMATDKGSFDGGDQGLLNSFFCHWPETPQHRLPFTYNTTPSAVYSYLPAYREFKQKISVIHFIGKDKPWHHTQRFADGSLFKPAGTDTEFLQLWWDTWDRHYGKHISPTSLISPVNTSSGHHHHHHEQPQQHHLHHPPPSEQTITWDMINIQPPTTTAKDKAHTTSGTHGNVKGPPLIKQKDIPEKSAPNTVQADRIGLHSGELPHYTFLQSSTFTEATMLEFELDHRARMTK
ncbi:glycogenin-1 [Lichtheimia corymbifera JMRC:FSU:9682]|uniref:glycogenin glucosyltransferase n=1 Tax=Lichtheimia corymbifera JMRC:FSU:9682 TaxID=1263082 RepID=A0A068RL92_9FUNG|nr:glycogenin-1 [Lichtheimia corymbifera JMRC:FSU:9682]